MAQLTQKVNVPVLWDSDNCFIGNQIYSVSVESIIGAVISKPPGIAIPGYSAGLPVDCLMVKDPELGLLYLSLTLAEYLDIIGNASGGGVNLDVINWTGGDEVPAGDTITSSALSGIIIFSVNKGGITIYNYTYTDGSPDGELDLTTDGGLAEDENIQILYKLA